VRDSLHFGLISELSISCSFQNNSLPAREDSRFEKLAKRCESCRALGIFRSGEEFMLCYDGKNLFYTEPRSITDSHIKTEFGLYVDKRGNPSRTSGTIEWEGTPERAALHHPYVLLFDSRFIEVRHLETGRLAQIIPGNDMRCVWDGRGLPSETSQEASVHAVMNAPEGTTTSGSRQSRVVTQHVFELVPTIPLYLPGSLSSPSTSGYFPQSLSPPHSPQLRPTSSWRS
jgi:hypothetical protein